MRKSARILVGAVVAAFVAGNLSVSVSAAAPTRLGSTDSAPIANPAQSAAPANASPGGGQGWTERSKSIEPQKVDLASLPRTKYPKGKASTRPLLVRDQQAYATAKDHPNGKPGLAITQGSTSSSGTTTGPRVPLTVGPNFPGMNSATDILVIGSSDEPPDTQIAVGSTRIVEMVNEVMQIYDKSGNPIANTTTSLADFFLVNSYWTFNYFASEQFVTSDPRVLYDATSGRWWASLLGYGPTTFDSLTFVAVSETSDPAGSWWIYAVDGEGPAPTYTPLLCDQPKIGVSSDKIVVGCSLFDFSDTFQGGLLSVASKSRMMAGLSPHETQFGSMDWFGLVPAQNITAAVPTVYVAYNSSAGGTGTAATQVLAVTGNVTLNASYSAVTPHQVDMSFTNVPPAAPQSGSADLIDTSDDRFMSAYVLNGKLYTSGGDSCTPAGDTTVRSCLRLVEVNLSTWALIQGATAGLVGKFIINPTLGVNSSGDVAFAYSTSSSTDYPDVENAVQPAGDPNTFVGGQVVAGSGPYVHSSPQSPSARWGDYSSVAMDPSSTSYVWVAGEFSNGPADGLGGTQWGTQIARFNAHIPPVCTATSLSPSVPSPQEPTVDITLTAAATCIDPATPDFQFWIKTPGTSTFAMVQDYGNGDTYDWASHVTLGTYTLEVRVRGTTETAKSYDSLKDVSYVITTTPCTLPTLDASPAPYPQVIGTAVTLTASTTCGAPPPLYQFWVRTPDLVFHLAQAYSPSNVYNWNAFNTQVGSYLLQVRVKNTGSLGAYDNLRSISYSRALCTTPSLDTGGATSPYISGSGAITLTASGACTSAVQYQFWYRDTSLVYHVLGGYGSSPTAAWNADYKAGNYLLQVRTRPLGSIAAYVTYTNLAFTLSGCGVPTLTPDVASPQLGGTTVNWTASATCTGTPQYKFLVRLPSLVWTLRQDWSATNTFAWSSHATLGTYIVEVLVRNSGANEDAGDNLKTAGYAIGICSAVSLDTGTASSPYASGSGAITLTASGACTSAVQYQFWYRDTSLVYHLIRGYGSSPTATWNADYKAGNYLLQVRTRPLGSIAAYVTYTNLAFTLSGCGVPTLTPDLSSPKVAGTTITWTGVATCTGTPQYKFLVRSPAGVWSLKQNWGAADTFVWQSPATVGTYLVEVLVRNTGANEDAGDNLKVVGYALK